MQKESYEIIKWTFLVNENIQKVNMIQLNYNNDNMFNPTEYFRKKVNPA